MNSIFYENGDPSTPIFFIPTISTHQPLLLELLNLAWWPTMTSQWILGLNPNFWHISHFHPITVECEVTTFETLTRQDQTINKQCPPTPTTKREVASKAQIFHTYNIYIPTVRPSSTIFIKLIHNNQLPPPTPIYRYGVREPFSGICSLLRSFWLFFL